MPLAIEALIPVTLTVFIGYMARQYFAVGEPVWNGIEKLTYYLFARRCWWFLWRINLCRSWPGLR